MSRPVYSIRFPMVREKTGLRRGPRFQRMPDRDGLFGARKIAATMVGSAIQHRERAGREVDQRLVRWQRATMRLKALWARVWAGQIDQCDPRLDAAANEAHRHVADYCAPKVHVAA